MIVKVTQNLRKLFLMFEGVKEQKVSDFLLFKDEELKGTEFMGTIEFDNGFALSIVRHESSYGGKMGLFEIMLCKGGIDGSPTCLPPITKMGILSTVSSQKKK